MVWYGMGYVVTLFVVLGFKGSNGEDLRRLGD